MIIIDEAAYVPDNVYTILRPMLLMSRGSLWMLSTPFGKRGFFYKEWISKDGEWSRFSVPASECPRFAAAEIEREKRRLPDRVFRQELNCEFIDPEEALFPTDLILRALTSDVSHLPLHTAGLFPNGFVSPQ